VSEFRYSNIEREMEVYGYDSFVKSHCRMCHGGCGVIVYLKDGKIAKLAVIPIVPLLMEHCAPKGLPLHSLPIIRTGLPILSKGLARRRAANGNGSHG